MAGACAAGLLAACALAERSEVAALECEDSRCVCTFPMADCDGDIATGCETDLERDPQHCGACGRDCFGSDCSRGHCSPFSVNPAGSGLTALAADETHVYACDREAQQLRAYPWSGDQVVLVADGQPCWQRLAASAGMVYWAVEGGSGLLERNPPQEALYRGGVALPGPERVAVAPVIRLLASSEGSLAWCEDRNRLGRYSIRLLHRGRSESQLIQQIAIEPDHNVDALALHRGEVFWSESRFQDEAAQSAVYRATGEGGAAEQVVSIADFRLFDLQVADDQLYWRAAPDNRQVPRPDPPYRIMRFDLVQRQTVELHRGNVELFELRADQSGAYWRERQTTLLTASGSTAEVSPLVEFQTIELLALSPTVVVWYNEANGLLAIAK